MAYWLNEMGGVPVHERVCELVLRGEVDPHDALSKGMVLRGGCRGPGGAGARGAGNGHVEAHVARGGSESGPGVPLRPVMMEGV